MHLDLAYIASYTSNIKDRKFLSSYGAIHVED